MSYKAAVFLLASFGLIAAAMAFPLISAEDIIDDTDPEDLFDDTPPEERYPDADIIITKDIEGNTLVTFKAYGEYAVTDEHPSEWYTETYPAETDVTLRNLSTVDHEFKIVYDGASVKKLTLFNIDTKASLNTSGVLEFSMYDGIISTLAFFSIDPEVKQYMGNSYDSMSTPLHTVCLDLYGGEIELLNPTSAMVSVTNYELNLYKDMIVHRLYTTGDNGKYSNVSVKISGAHVGYMSNIASKIGTLSYDFDSGAVDYLCLGANTEHISTKDFSKLATSYVSGDVRIHIASNVEIKKCIMGAGLLNMPNMLCNGEYRKDQVIHMIVLDAPSVTVANDSAFLIKTRSSAYNFTSYRIGQNPYAYSLMDTITYKDTAIKVYSEEGIWDSVASCSIPVGGMLSVNTGFLVQMDGRFVVEKGATVFNSNDFILCGTLIIEGEFRNNSVIQCRIGSVLEGETTGIGYQADYVSYTTPTSALNVISQRTAVVIDQQEAYPIESISAILSDDRRSVSIKVESSHRIYGDKFMLSLQEIESTEEFDQTYRLDVKGIDATVLRAATIDISLPTDRNVCTAAYVFDTESNEYVVVGTSLYANEVIFNPGYHNQFYLKTYEDDVPNPNPPPASEGISNLDYFLMAAIIAVICVTVYAIITMKRD